MPISSTGITWVDKLLRAREAMEDPRTNAWIDYFKSLNAGPDRQFREAKTMRHVVDRGVEDARRHDLNLRDAEHYLFSRTNTLYSPLLGRLAALYSVPTYSALKVAAQSYPWTLPVLSPIFDPMLQAKAGTTMEGLKSSTPPDFAEVYWGLKPIFESEVMQKED